LTDEQLRSVWCNWISIGDVMPKFVGIRENHSYWGKSPTWLSVDPSSQRLTICVSLSTYGVEVQCEGFVQEHYKGFRERVLSEVVPRLRTADNHFPFSIAQRDGKCDWDSFHLSSDPMVWVANEWHRFSLGDVFRDTRNPIVIQVPATVLFARKLPPPEVLQREEKERTI